jgi:replicative DNA helicase
MSMTIKPYLEAQRGILSIVMNKGTDAFEVANRYLDEKHFTAPAYQMMWRATKWLYDNDHEIDHITILNSMEVTRDSKGNIAYLLLNPETGEHQREFDAIKNFKENEGLKHLQSYVDIMLDKWKVTRYNQMAQAILDKARNGKATAGQLQAILTEYADKFAERDRKQPHTLIEVANSLIEKNKQSQTGDQSVVHTGIPMIDRFMWLSPGNQTIIAGDTGHGKTSLALQIAWNIAKQRRRVVDTLTGMPIYNDNGEELWTHRRILFFSLEMREDELLTKLCCIENNITVQEFMVDKSPAEKVKMLEKFKEKLPVVAPNFMVDYTISTLKDIHKKTNMVASSYGGIDIVIVDYLQLVEDVKDTGYRREDEVYRAVSRFFKKMAMRLDTHTIALSQLNKPFQDKTGAVMHKPTLDRLFGSSALKQDATHVIFTYREWAVGIKRTSLDDESMSTLYLNRLILAKHRFGNGQVEILVGFIPYLSYYLPLQAIRDANLTKSTNPNIKFPKLKDFMKGD